MPELRGFSGQAVVGILQRMGFDLRRSKGSHPYWNEPTTEFAPEEIERIVNLHPLDGCGNPMTPEELEWNRKQFPH